MAGRTRTTDAQDEDTRAGSSRSTGGTGKSSADEKGQPGGSAAGRSEGHRTATLDLPFVTAQFRAPNLHIPNRGDLDAATRGARSMLPSGRSMLFLGGLAATVAVGVIEWPVAAAIGVGAALAGQSAAGPQQETPAATSTSGSGDKS